jgi:hypothetical protein
MALFCLLTLPVDITIEYRKRRGCKEAEYIPSKASFNAAIQSEVKATTQSEETDETDEEKENREGAEKPSVFHRKPAVKPPFSRK